MFQQWYVILICESCYYPCTQTDTYRHISFQVDDNGAEYAFSSHVEESLWKYLSPQSLVLKCENFFHDYATQTMSMMHMPKYCYFALTALWYTLTLLTITAVLNIKRIPCALVLYILWMRVIIVLIHSYKMILQVFCQA